VMGGVETKQTSLVDLDTREGDVVLDHPLLGQMLPKGDTARCR
jgi:hypothetical protein